MLELYLDLGIGNYAVLNVTKIENSYAIGIWGDVTHASWTRLLSSLFSQISSISSLKFMSIRPGTSRCLSFCMFQSLRFGQIGVLFTADELFKPHNGSCGGFQITALSRVGYGECDRFTGTIKESFFQVVSCLTFSLRPCILFKRGTSLFSGLYKGCPLEFSRVW